jgi:hypothetical protein
MKISAFGILLLFGLLGASAPPPACTAREYRQFDFWQGNWNVYATGTRQLVGTNSVTRELNGCVLQEHWRGASGTAGTSFNIYDAAAKHWHQTWVDGGGGLLLLDGAMHDGKMILSGTMPGRDGKPVMNRIVYTPNADGSVRQVWTASRDGGRTWTTSFDGTYRAVHQKARL